MNNLVHLFVYSTLVWIKGYQRMCTSWH